jgi:RND family efflux transporter MFP subunit
MTQDPRDRPAQLEDELRRAYDALGEVTSRLLLVNESAEAVLGTSDRTELAERFLEIVARACDTRRSALFAHDGRSLYLAASRGLGEAEQEALLESRATVRCCDRALERNLPFAFEPELAPSVPADSREAAGETAGEPGDGEVQNAEEDDDASEPEFGVYLPARLDDQPVAVLALGARAMGRPYSADDLSLLTHLLTQLAVALHRSLLMERSEDRLRELDALLRVSREITSTLDVDAVLRGVVNTAAAVVENDRCELVLFEGKKLRVRAVNGITRVPSDFIEETHLGEVMEWLALTRQRLQVGTDDLGGEKPVPGADVFGRYFEVQPMRSFMALPLRDDQGVLGFLCLESKQDSWNLDPSEGDALDILSAQTTVALRNAMLYSQVPMKGVAAPMLKARARWAALSPQRQRWVLAGSVGGLLLALLPLMPGRVGGSCELKPAQSYSVRAETDGVVRRVLARGGEEVQAGQVLALLEDPALSAQVSQLRGQLESARVAAAQAQERGDALEYRLQELQIQDVGDQLQLAESRSRRTRLQAPADGHIMELNLAEQVGRYLEAGDAFCRVSALANMRAEVLVGENEIRRVLPGATTQLKVMAYPTRTFRGRVAEVSWQAEDKPKGGRAYRVRVDLENPDLALRSGMTGHAKVHTRPRSLLGLVAEPFSRWVRLTWW